MEISAGLGGESVFCCNIGKKLSAGLGLNPVQTGCVFLDLGGMKIRIPFLKNRNYPQDFYPQDVFSSRICAARPFALSSWPARHPPPARSLARPRARLKRAYDPPMGCVSSKEAASNTGAHKAANEASKLSFENGAGAHNEDDMQRGG